MRLKRLLAVLAAGVLATALTSAGALAQTAPQGNGPVVKPPRMGRQVTLQVKVKNMKVMGGYYVKTTTEVYKIANKIPEVLEPLAKSGETVTIQALARGDLLTIETINGKKYEAKPQPVAK
jgi:hypothetical protein